MSWDTASFSQILDLKLYGMNTKNGLISRQCDFTALIELPKVETSTWQEECLCLILCHSQAQIHSVVLCQELMVAQDLHYRSNEEMLHNPLPLSSLSLPLSHGSDGVGECLLIEIAWMCFRAGRVHAALN